MGKGKDRGPISVKTMLISETLEDNYVSSSGTAVAFENVEVRSEISGKIVRLNLAEGGTIQKGQLIAKIKDDDILAQLHKIDIDEKLAHQTEARHKKLLDINAISREEYELSQNKVFNAKADREILKVQLAKTEIRAPFSGKLGLKNISMGAYVTPSNIITTLLKINPLKIDFDVPEKYLQNVIVGQKVNFEIEGSIEKFSAKIIAIDPQIDQNLRTLKVRAVCENSKGLIIPGMFLKVQINLGTKKSIMIPTETVIPILDGNKVFVKRNGIAKEIKIETGLRNASKLQITKGLMAGDSLIISGLMTLKADAAVK